MKKALFLVPFIFIMAFAKAQIPETLNFTHIGWKQGLSQSSVLSIAQDRNDNLWFATFDGLNRYDGYQFTVYRHREGDTSTLANDYVRCVKCDSHGRLWVGTQKGLSLYQAKTDDFINFQETEGKIGRVDHIEEISEEAMLITLGRKVRYVDVKNRKITTRHIPVKLANLWVTSMFRQGDRIYLGTFREGIFVYSISKKQLVSLQLEELIQKEVKAIYPQSESTLWVGTEGSGLYCFNPQTRTYRNYRSEGRESISSNYVRVLTMDADNHLWIGTKNGLNIYNDQSGTFNTYHVDRNREESLSQTSIRSIFMDSQNGMWIGTFYGGLNYYHSLRERFSVIEYIPGRNSLNDNVVNCIVEDPNNGMWYGTNNGGLNFYDYQDKAFRYITMHDGLSSNDVKAVFIDRSREEAYIGTHGGGLNIYHSGSRRMEQVSNVPHAYAIIPTRKGDYWISALNYVARFNPVTRKAVRVECYDRGRVFKSNQISYMLYDSHQRLWLCGNRGLTVFEERGDRLERIILRGMEAVGMNEPVNSICETSENLFWICTRQGVYRYDERLGTIKKYTTDDGLSNNVVYGILEDAHGKLWMSTNQGLSCFNPKNESFRNYFADDGLSGNEFVNSSFCRTADGMMYFGGVHGVTAFHPDQMLDNPYTPQVQISGLSLYGNMVRPGDESGILTQNIAFTRQITLASHQNVFALHFVVSNYISGSHNTYAYKLEGFDKKWYYTRSNRMASYSNLSQGTYRFLVKAANSDGIWNEQPVEIEITVLPVWYCTWWAYMLYVIVLGSIVFGVVRYFWIRKSMQAQIEMERGDKERQKEVNEMKLRFFINISHELRTPLTMILAPLQEAMMNTTDSWMRRQLTYVQRNTNRLLHLVNQLMDYRRAELGVFHLKVTSVEVYQLIEKVYQLYERTAYKKKITYILKSDINRKSLLCDANYLELITNNLLSNAFKYTPEGHSVTLGLKLVDDDLIIQVSDTGSGIPIDKQSKVFERFYQIDSEHTGSGIGLSLVQRLVELHHGRIELESQEGRGSTFTVYVPTNPDAYSEEERRPETDDEKAAHVTNSNEMYLLDTDVIDEGEIVSDTGTSVNEKKERILLVEDQGEILSYLAEELGGDYHITCAVNGEEAMKIVKEQEIDLILTDVMMPVMDGLQLCKQVKQNLLTSHIPVVILSAKAELNEQIDGLLVGADDYIYKPFSMRLVKTKIRNLFRTRYRILEHYNHSIDLAPEKFTFNPLDEELLKRAVEVVEKHLDDVDFTTDVFAAELLMSRSNLHLKMKALTGESTNDFIKKIRFKRACELLKERRYTVSEICVMVGFNTPSYFAASFKKYFGCLPSEYGKK